MIVVNVIAAISIPLFASLVGSSQMPLLGVSIGNAYIGLVLLFVFLIVILNLCLWKGVRWAFALAFVVVAIYFLSLLMFVDGIGLIVAILLLYYVSRPLVKDWLSGKPTVAA
jgi:hypothetical protein